MARDHRRLAAIVSLDVAGYSRLMGVDDSGTLAALKAHRRELIDPKIAEHGGRIVKTTGDGLLLEFPSVVDAVCCTVEVQRGMAERNEGIGPDRRLDFRIGINVGDIIIDGDDIFGDGVNVAARLEALADPGGICVSRVVRDQVLDKLSVAFEDLGAHQVKNIARPVDVFRVLSEGSAAAKLASAGGDIELPLPDKPSIAVLPFANMSGDPEQEYFADGITEDIITDIACVSGLFVIARNSSFVYKKQAVDVKEVGRKLGVRHVLEGSVRKAGARVRITAQLIDTRTGGHVWAERFDRDLEDIFMVQDEVTRRIVDALKVNLTGGEQERRADRAKVNSEAYDNLIRARRYALQFKAESNIEARRILERTIAIDPGLARTYANLALVHNIDFINGWNSPTPDYPEQALALAQKACAISPNDALLHNILGVTLVWLRRLHEAESATRRALELDPNLADAHGTLGNELHFSGRNELAIDAYQQALRLDPQFDLWLHATGRAQFALKRYVEAEASFKRRLIVHPHSDVTRAYLASLYGHTGRVGEARAIWDELTRINPKYSVEHTVRILPYNDPAPLEQFFEGLRKAGLTKCAGAVGSE